MYIDVIKVYTHIHYIYTYVYTHVYTCLHRSNFGSSNPPQLGWPNPDHATRKRPGGPALGFRVLGLGFRTF